MTLDLLLLFLFRWSFLTERGSVTKLKDKDIEPSRRAYSAGRKKRKKEAKFQSERDSGVKVADRNSLPSQDFVN